MVSAIFFLRQPTRKAGVFYMQEIWKDIPNYFGKYQISNFGNVKSTNYKSTKKERIMKPTINSSGYYKIELYKNGKSNIYYVHRLVALVFIPNPENKTQINHIDGNKTNNNVSNLEWVSVSENQIHAINLNLRKRSPMTGRTGKQNPNSKKILQYDMAGNFIAEWNGIAEAARQINGKACSISNNLCKRTKSSYGYIWKYADD